MRVVHWKNANCPIRESTSTVGEKFTGNLKHLASRSRRNYSGTNIRTNSIRSIERERGMKKKKEEIYGGEFRLNWTLTKDSSVTMNCSMVANDCVDIGSITRASSGIGQFPGTKEKRWLFTLCRVSGHSFAPNLLQERVMQLRAARWEYLNGRIFEGRIIRDWIFQGGISGSLNILR